MRSEDAGGDAGAVPAPAEDVELRGGDFRKAAGQVAEHDVDRPGGVGPPPPPGCADTRGGGGGRAAPGCDVSPSADLGNDVPLSSAWASCAEHCGMWASSFPASIQAAMSPLR